MGDFPESNSDFAREIVRLFRPEMSTVNSLTSKDGEEEEHDWIEEAKAHGEGVLVDNGGDHEHGEHGS